MPCTAGFAHFAHHYRAMLQQSAINPRTLRPAQDSTEPPGHALTLAQCLNDPGLLTQAIADLPPCREQPALFRACASVVHQSLALDILAPRSLALFLDGETWLPDPGRIRLWRDGDNLRWHDHPGPAVVDTAGFIAGMGERLRHWYPLFRQHLGVSAGAYWSSSGLGLCSPYSALYNLAPQVPLCEQATAWLAQFDCDAGRFIDWIALEFNNQPCAIPQRRGCCQKYRLPGGGLCGTCGIYRKQRLVSDRNRRQ